MNARYQLLDDSAIERLEPPDWLIEDLMFTASLVLLFGEPEVGKTFVALALAFAIATGTPWADRNVKRGTVIYVAAEGIAGIAVRVRAWKQAHKVAGRTVGVHFVREAVYLTAGKYLDYTNVDAFIETIRPLEPVLIVIDTLARCMFGSDEDSARDMGLFVAAIDRIRRELNATVLLLHHPVKRKKDKVERGSGALRGAMDTVMWLSRSGQTVILDCQKQKDAADFKPINLTLEVVDLGQGVASCIATSVGERGPTMPPDTERPTAEQRSTLAALACFPNGTAPLKAWREQAGASERTFQRTANTLCEFGYVAKLPGRRGVYRLVESTTATGNHTQTNVSSPPPTAAGGRPEGPRPASFCTEDMCDGD